MVWHLLPVIYYHSIQHTIQSGICYTVYRKISCITRTCVYMQDDFLLLLTGNHVYSMHRLLLKSFQWWASGLHRFDELTPPLIPVSALFARVVQISWLMQHSMDITQRNVLLVSRHCGWANLTAASGGTRPYYGWSLGAMSIALM